MYICPDLTVVSVMFDALKKPLPKYLLEGRQLTWTVTFTALFSLIALFLCIPFSDNVWFALTRTKAFVYTISFLFLCLLLVSGSKALMYRCRNESDFSVGKYLMWNFGEILLISLMYTLFTIQGSDTGIIPEVAQPAWMVFLGSFSFVLACIGVPYVIAALYLTVADKNNTIRLMNYSNVVSDAPLKPYEDKKITLFDNNGILKFSIDEDNLYFIESDDNYIKVWYTDSEGEMKQYMLRCRLKTVEDSFAGSVLVRCHRKFIVNITKVRILKSEKEGYRISLGLDNVDTIPISKTYEKNVLSRFNSRS